MDISIGFRPLYKKYISFGKLSLAHISSGKDVIDDKSHGDYITEWDIKKYMWLFQDFDVEVEAKKKEKALKKL